MPMYLFLCRDCAQEFEKLLSYTKINEVVCPHCGSTKIDRVYDGATVFGGAAPAQEPMPACDRGCPGCPNAKHTR